ncbi:glutathionylspermidine synthase [Haemophilus influenzae]|uniref:Glutathionylspermidine synthase n=1 Tax=Haemophilus influenzae TaxID=727 RepID=A0A2X1RJZ1_HAEIF|nr:glutathionylspermidine synthase [Haemophilus influenzae]
MECIQLSALGLWVMLLAVMGLREDFTAVTGNDSHFIPHYFVP